MMSEGNRAPTRQFVEFGNAHRSKISGTDGEKNLRSQLLDRRMTTNDIDRQIIGIVALLSTQLEALIQLVREFNEKSSRPSTERNVMSERSRSSGERSDNKRIKSAW